MGVEGAPDGLLADWFAQGSGASKEVGILLVHGFTGSPASMRPWAEYLNQRGYTVKVPLLPGHGTTPHDLNLVKWQEWPAKVESDLQELLRTCSKVFICGLSMGGGTTLNIATRYSKDLAGIILVNPMIHVKFVPHQLAWAISRFQKMRESVGDDIKRPGITEYGYDALPAVGVYELLKMLHYTRKRLHDVTAPMLLFHSVDDHTLPVTNTEIVMKGVGSRQKQRIELVNSYHVATLDYDQEVIFENSRLFIESHS
jgi:carboxylesterase|uniref:alpha/beta hydrolase n=1 Tax=Candidatus Planktophila sp. TaxID=2175601 RepID=UPI00404B4009